MTGCPPDREAEVEAAAAALVAWARRHPDIRALALAGSRVRGTARRDSDLDLVVLTVSPHRYLAADDCLAALSPSPPTPPRPRGVMTERRLVLPSGLELDAVFGPPSWAATDPVDAGTRRVVADGIRPLYDPDGLLAELTRAVAHPRPCFVSTAVARGAATSS